jgi:hypothetical protein
MRHMLDANVLVLRRRLTGPGALLDFGILEDLAKEGYTDYLAMATELFGSSVYPNAARRGMFVTWASDRPGGFIDDDLDTLQRIQRRLAIACKTVIQSQIARNIAEAYLGRQTGQRVLAIFPVEQDAELPELTHRVTDALHKSLAFTDSINDERIGRGLEPIRYGIGLNIGSVMYGNIGVPERLAFSAIGPTVIEVARIEKLTKTIGSRVLATREVAAVEPKLWRSMGSHRLEGLGQAQELFGFREEAAQQAA